MENKMTLAQLQTMFPNDNDNNAYTGYIPMEYFNQNEADIRQVLREHHMRVYYRGPRPQSWAATQTRRVNAVAAVVYDK